MVEGGGPLIPDPFDQSESSDSALAGWRYFDNGRWIPEPDNPVDFDPPWRHPYWCGPVLSSSITCVAYIRKGELDGIMAVFEDDAVDEQPRWLSEAISKNNFRFVHGLRMCSRVGFDEQFLNPTKVTGILRTNPSKIKHVPLVRAPATEEAAQESGMEVDPPPWPGIDQPYVVGMSSARARNGFLIWPIVSMGKPFKKYIHSEESTWPPRIGSSLQMWHTTNGCKCVSVLHNHFPHYRYYLDGVMINHPQDTDFDRFDHFDVDVEWKEHMAYRLYDALLPYDEIHERYPGGILFGWYRFVDSTGKIEWCGRDRNLYYVKFPGRSRDERREWWINLREIVKRLESMRQQDFDEGERPQDLEWLYEESFGGEWGKLANGT